MPNWTWQGLHFVQILALGLWLGGIVAVGALTAPVVFALAPTRSDAGRIMAGVFERLDYLIWVCMGGLVLSSVLMVIWYHRISPWYAIQYVCIGMMSASAIYSSLVVSPRIRHLRQAGRVNEERFRRLHRSSVLMMQFNLACGTVALLFA